MKPKKDIRIPIVFNTNSSFTPEELEQIKNAKTREELFSIFIKKFNLSDHYQIDDIEQELKILAETNIPDFEQALQYATDLVFKRYDFETEQKMTDEEIKQAEKYEDIVGLLYMLMNESEEQKSKIKQHYLEVFYKSKNIVSR